MFFDSLYFWMVAPIFALSAYVQYKLQSKFKKFSKQRLSANLTGKEIAEKMLNDHGIYDVKIISVKGQLSDHYNPQKKTVNLSESVFNKANTASAAVAAHFGYGGARRFGPQPEIMVSMHDPSRVRIAGQPT